MKTHILKQNQKNDTMKFDVYKIKLTQIKKILYIIAFFLCSTGISLNAQTAYQSIFGDSSTTYHVFTSLTCYVTSNTGLLGCGYTFKYNISYQDTAIFNDTIYYRTGRDLYIREDTNTGRLYRYIPDLNKEFLTCDMSLNVGDTFQLPLFSSDYRSLYFYEEAGVKLVVDSIVYINGRKVIYFPYIILYENNKPYPVFSSAYYDGKFSEYSIIPSFIEGIGPTFSPFAYTVHSLETDLNVMLCVEKNDTLTFMLNEELGCFQAAAAINEIENAKINIFPNPANDYITLTFNNINDVSGEIIIIDIIGNVVYRKTIHDNSTRFNVASFSQGVYTVVFTNKKGKSISKFVKLTNYEK
jgi:hypothetical protein